MPVSPEPPEPGAADAPSLDQPPLPKRRFREEPDPSPEPKAEIMDLAGRLQDLIDRRREQQSATPTVASLRESRFRPRQPVVPADPDAEVLAVLAAARETTARPGPSYHGPHAEDRLEAFTGRWLGRALWPALCALAAVLAFVLGRHAATPGRTAAPASAAAPASPGVTPKPTVPHWSEKSLTALDDVLTARRADPARAGALARALRLEHGALPGLDLFLAENLLHANRPNDATTALLPLMRADPPTVAAIARLGFIAARTRQLDEAANYFAMACAADPFRGDLFHRWAEALRRQGKNTEAVTRFKQALLRPTDDEGARPALRDSPFRLRLARLEAGDVEPVRQETTAALAGPANPETGRWLLTAAALDLLGKNFPAAAATLARARAAVPAGEWDRLTDDLFFRNYADRREVAEFLPAPGSPADVQRVAALDLRTDVDFIDP